MRKFNFKKIISALAILSATLAAFCCSSTTTFAIYHKKTINTGENIRLINQNPSISNFEYFLSVYNTILSQINASAA